jgi:phosphoglycolate phosphatase
LNPRTLICFDLDGVLYSSEPFIADAYRESIARVNELRPGSFARIPTTGEILAHVGWPVPVILERLFPHVDPEAVALLFDVTLDVICARVSVREGVLFDGVDETLHRLARCFPLAVASNGRRLYIETVLETYGLAALFLPRITVDQIGDRSPVSGRRTADKTAVLRAYLSSENVAPADTVMVGDRSSDVEAARGVGCRFVGCDYGHGHRDEIEGAGPIVRSFAELPAAIERSRSASV